MWTATCNALPTEGVEVNTLTHSGLEQTLVYSKNLWWTPTMSMYVYYTPDFWQHI